MGLFKNIMAGLNPVSVIADLTGDLIGGFMEQDENLKNRNQVDQTNQMNYDMQKEFAQNGLRWKVADAVAAGLHPLAALGATGYSASPSFVNGEPDNSMSHMVSRMGQNISRAVAAGQTNAEREATRLNLESMAIDNDLKKLQLKKLMTDMSSTKPMPTYGPYTNAGSASGGGDDIFGKSDPLQASVEIPPVSDVTFAVTRTGLRPEPSRQLAQANQNSMLSSIGWDIRRYAIPKLTGWGFGDRPDPRRYPLPRGYDYWRWNRWDGEYQPGKYHTDGPSWSRWKENLRFGNSE